MTEFKYDFRDHQRKLLEQIAPSDSRVFYVPPGIGKTHAFAEWFSLTVSGKDRFTVSVPKEKRASKKARTHVHE